MLTVLEQDYIRYGENRHHMPKFQVYFRKTQQCQFKPLKLLYKALMVYHRKKHGNEIYADCKIGGGLYLGHPYGIMINHECIIGNNVSIHKDVTLGQENRGKRKGAPILGNDVWIGINSTLVGKIIIGNDVLIAPNSFVNFDVPDHSIVMGNPARIIPSENATEGYITNKVDITQ